MKTCRDPDEAEVCTTMLYVKRLLNKSFHYNMVAMAHYSADALRALLRQGKTATLDELKQALGTNVDMTVFRKLAELAYRSSYSHGGRYYTLDEIARFDELGLWSHRSAWFSRYGTLLATLEALVSAADAGYFAHELKECLHVEVKAPLWRLVNDERVVREKVAGLYLYCSPDAEVRTHQLASRRARHGAGQAAPEAGSAVLTDDVKKGRHHSLLQLARRATATVVRRTGSPAV